MNLIKRKYLLIMILFIAIPKISISQVHQDWSVFYNYNNGGGGFRYISIDNSGNVIAAGGIASDYLIIKYNTFGIQEWLVTYGGPSYENNVLLGITTDDFNNVYATGRSKGTETNYDYATENIIHQELCNGQQDIMDQVMELM